MRSRILAAAFTALALAASAASAGVPSPANSTVPPCLLACPMGDVSFAVTVRDIANNPVAGSTVVLDFSNCASAYLCAQRGSDPYIVDPVARLIRMPTNASGVATFPLRVGGFCAGVNVYADGVLLATRTLKSPDQDGNGVVLGTDFTLFFPKLGTSDASADFACDGAVDGDDQIVMNIHGSHSCDGIIDAVRPRTWGALKQHYR